ncbi:MAG: sugar porter family MFS transporter [Myxococcota bacterium]
MPAGPAAASTVRVTAIAAIAAVGGFLFGFDTAVINGTVGALEAQFQATELATGLTVSSALVGSAIGAFLAGRLADRYGRARTMQLTALLFVVSGFFSGAALSLWDLSFWRLVGGLAIGLASVIAPAYISEVSPARLRGRLGSLQQLAIVTGIFAALLGDYAIAAVAGSASAPAWLGIEAWRWMFWSELVPATLYGLGAFFLPESPRYLVARGREAEALEVLRVIEGPGASHKLDEIRETVRTDRPGKLADLRRAGTGLLPIVWVGIALSAFQQLVGINVIFYYSSVLWQAVGFSEGGALAITVITSVTNIVTTLLAMATIDRLGRKPLLVAGSIGMAVTLGILAYTFSSATVDAAGNPSLPGNAGVVALVAANAYVFCFGFSWGPVVWVLLGEMFPNRIRAVALSVAATAQWLTNFLVSATFPLLLSRGLGLAYGLYATAAVVSLFFVLRFVPETKGRELEQM